MEAADHDTPVIIGGKFYRTGIPCEKGHDSERFVSTGRCRECNRISCKNRVLRKRDKTPGAWDEYWERLYRSQENNYTASLARTRRERESNLRMEAKRNGDTKYRSGKICPRGHIGYRYTSSTGCVECASEASASDRKKEYDKKYYIENSERIKHRSSEYAKSNREEVYERIKSWQSRNPDRVKSTKQSYKHRRRGIEGKGITGPELMKWKSAQDKVCFWCGERCENDFHVDHIYPLSKGGEHAEFNLAISCPSCNVRKSSKDPEKFIEEILS